MHVLLLNASRRVSLSLESKERESVFVRVSKVRQTKHTRLTVSLSLSLLLYKEVANCGAENPSKDKRMKDGVSLSKIKKKPE